jgi:hypothetical protein
MWKLGSSVRLSVIWYQRLNHLSDFHENQCWYFSQKVQGLCELRENRLRGSLRLNRGVNDVLSPSIWANFGTGSRHVIRHVGVTFVNIGTVKTTFYDGRKYNFSRISCTCRHIWTKFGSTVRTVQRNAPSRPTAAFGNINLVQTVLCGREEELREQRN